ncbi:hypothetical protein [Streptomyces canus]|uniref:hypothetical protein n=1 Tax=Streptomyces canus TaxID=58343 RepID=UPI00277DDAD1|nr:hypothetical protein [Streptomyces canus]MDQ1065294.1 hypothetical protein [Streptomyces canus]
MTNELNRRGFVGTTAAVADAAAMARRLSARGTGEQQQTRTHAASGLRKALPVHVPRASVKPDMPSVSNGPDVATAPGFLRHPSDRPTTVSGAPGKGPQVHRAPLRGTVPPPGNSFSCPRTPRSSSPAWRNRPSSNTPALTTAPQGA